MVENLLKEIFHELKDRHLSPSAIPEHLIILHSFQFATEYRKGIRDVWDNAD